MKINIITAIILGSVFTVNAQIQDETINGATFKLNGRVGIGTITPTAELEVKSSNNDNSEIHINAGTDGGKSIIRFQDAGQGAWAFLSNYPVVGKFSLYNYHNNKNSIIVDQTGNVGIGTVSPQAPLHSVGFGNMKQLRLERTGTNAGFSDLGGANGNFRVWAGGYNNGKKFIVEGATGNVGIGTLTPDSKLTVAGKIHSQEVKVTINAGADFVFDTDYKLSSLDFIEKYIQKNKHLPEIASAKEMKKNGVNIGDFQIQLLQKIEELTLYTIKQENKIKEQAKKIKRLEALDEKLAKLQLRLEKLETKD